MSARIVGHKSGGITGTQYRCLVIIDPFKRNGSHVMGSCTPPYIETFKLNGSKIIGSCAPPFKSPESVAGDAFSARFDNGFEARPHNQNLGSQAHGGLRLR